MPQDLNLTGTALLEIGTEELPPHFFYEALPQLESLAAKQLSLHRLNYGKINTFGTPRRLVLEILELRDQQPDHRNEIRGPARASAYDENGKPTPALLGFLKSQNASPDSVQIKDYSGKPYVAICVEEKGKPAAEILASLLPEIIAGVSFPKSMRWDGKFMFGRPIRWILALFEKKVIPFELAGLKSGPITFGHRSYFNEPMAVTHPKEYRMCLQKAHVIAHHRERAELIRSQVVALALSKSGNVFRIDSILDEVAMLVEYPMAFLGSFEKRFLALPEDVLITVMQHHQRYFPLVDKQGKLLPYFVGVRNGTQEGLEEVRFGNEQVIRARFKDAEYFFNVDRKAKLLDRLKVLENLVFQKNLGTLLKKVERLKKLAPVLAAETKLENQIQTEDLNLAIDLCKCDLATQMVFEFPKLQGAMGREYARLESYPESICQAILDHYLPRFQGDKLPATPIGTLIGIADRLDTLVGCLGLNLKPTGSSDPLGLRRNASTLLQILTEKGLDVNLNRLAEEAFKEYERTGLFKEIPIETVISEVAAFLLERAETLWKAAGVRYDLGRAFGKLILEKPSSSFKRAQFLEKLRTTEKEKFVAFITAWVRIFNILKSKEAQGMLHNSPKAPGLPRPEDLKETEEKNLLKLAEKLAPSTKENLSGDRLREAWEALCQFQNPINTFFEKILVMCPETDLRNKRLSLLWNLRALMLESFGDLTQVVLD